MTDTIAIVEQLRSDAVRQVPPFGSDGVRMAAAAGEAVSSALLGELQGDSFVALLALEALRAADRTAFERLPPSRRAQIYARALADSEMFNTWGAPQRLSDTAHAFAALGADAVGVLLPLLEDRRDAPQEGSRNATASQLDRVRVRDYAWMLLCAASGRTCEWTRDPAVRDVAIDALAAELGGSR